MFTDDMLRSRGPFKSAYIQVAILL